MKNIKTLEDAAFEMMHGLLGEWQECEGFKYITEEKVNKSLDQLKKANPGRYDKEVKPWL